MYLGSAVDPRSCGQYKIAAWLLHLLWRPSDAVGVPQAETAKGQSAGPVRLEPAAAVSAAAAWRLGVVAASITGLDLAAKTGGFVFGVPARRQHHKMPEVLRQNAPIVMTRLT